jgi:predicted nuclease with TOPRIM domain
MSPRDSATANLQRLHVEALNLEGYLSAFVTQNDVNRIGQDSTRFRNVLAVTDLSRVDDAHDLDELRERLNALRSDISVLLVSFQNLHEKVETLAVTLGAIEDAVDNPDEDL